MTTSIFAFIIVLGVLIFVHEFGHFLVARLCGVGVEKFSLGFGPRIVGRKIGLTDYRISAIPLGGYVKMVGDEPDAEVPPELLPLSFTHKSLPRRFLIVAAGPVFNLLLAVVIFFVLFLVSGTFILQPTVGKITPDSPAARGGLSSGDRIIAIDGRPVDTWEEMAGLITGSGGRSLVLTVRRDGQALELTVTPEQRKTRNIFGEETSRYVIGITSAGDAKAVELGPLDAMTQSVVQTYEITRLTILSVVKLVTGSVSAKTLGGPLMIAEMAGQQAKEGTSNLVFFIALLSINLAILNFLPIPVLDGGHLMFFTIEAIMRRPLSLRAREIAQQAGIFILILLMIFVFYNDITRMFFS
jgi:regulator of sigma E protease